MKDALDLYLDDAEKAALEQFWTNERMREAVRKVLLFALYNNGTLKKGKKADPTHNFTLGLVSNAEQLGLDNEKIGAQLRAAWEGIRTLENAFSNIAQYQVEDKPSKKSNPAI